MKVTRLLAMLTWLSFVHAFSVAFSGLKQKRKPLKLPTSSRNNNRCLPRIILYSRRDFSSSTLLHAETSNENLASLIDLLRDEVRGLQIRTNETERDLSEIKIVNKQLKAQNQVQSFELEALQHQLAQFKIANKQLKAQLQVQSLEVEALQHQLAQINSENAILRSENAILRSENAILRKDLDAVNAKVEVLQKELRGIRRAFQPAVIYSIMETCIHQSMRTHLYTMKQGGKPPDAQKISHLVMSASNHATSVLVLVFNNKMKGWKRPTISSSDKVKEMKIFKEDVISGLILYLSIVPERFVIDWPPERNIVSHNGLSLKALFPNIDFSQEFGFDIDANENTEYLTDELVEEYIQKIVLKLREARSQEPKSLKDLTKSLIVILEEYCSHTISDEVKNIIKNWFHHKEN